MVRLGMTSTAVAFRNKNIHRQASPRNNINGSSSTSICLLCLSIFILGLLVGHIHGRTTCGAGSDLYHSYSWSPPAQPPPGEHDTKCTSSSSLSSSSKTTHGWNSIDVYFGKTDHIESQLNQTQQWFAQGRQDEAVLALLRHAKDNQYQSSSSSSSSPIFIDLAANDATILSNTYALERFHGWKGYCIEPNPMYWYNLTHFRPNCTIISAVVGGGMKNTNVNNNNNDDENGDDDNSTLVSFLYSAGDHGGIADTGFDNGKKFQRHATKEYTVSLQHIFERYQIPPIVDYLSLDVEGAEDFILHNFPLDQYQFRVLTIERVEKKPQLKAKLERHGYKSLVRLTRWGDSLWAHSTVIEGMTQDELDSILDEFDARKQRLAQKERAAAAAAAATKAAATTS